MINDSFSNVTSPRLIQDWNSTKVTSIVASNMVASSGSWATRWPHVLFISSFTRTPEWIFLLSPVRFPRENSLALIFKYYVSSADKGTPLEFFNTFWRRIHPIFPLSGHFSFNKSTATELQLSTFIQLFFAKKKQLRRNFLDAWSGKQSWTKFPLKHGRTAILFTKS